MPEFKVSYSHTSQVETFETKEAALDALGQVFKSGFFELDGLVWADEETSENDDGSRAIARIREVY